MGPDQTIVLDLSGVEFMDSSCLKVFVQARGRLTRDGGSLILRNPSPLAHRLLTLADVDSSSPKTRASTRPRTDRPVSRSGRSLAPWWQKAGPFGYPGGAWFNEIGAFLGPRTSGTRSRRGRSRRSTSSSTRSGSSRGCGCSTSAAGPGGTRSRWPGGASTVVGVDLSPDFVALAREPRPRPRACRRVLRGARRARPRRSTASSTPSICLCQGGFGLLGGRRRDAVVRPHRRPPLRPGGRLAVSAFSAAFARALPGGRARTFDPATGVLHERRDGARPERATERAVRPLDHLLHRARARAARARRPGSTSTAVHGVTPGRVRRQARRRSTIPSSCCSHGAPCRPG